MRSTPFPVKPLSVCTPSCFEAVGVPYSELIDRLVAYALERGAV